MTARKARATVKKAVTEHVEALRREQQLDTRGEALAALAVRVAALLDDGEPVMMTASWARELRATLMVLGQEDAGDGDDDSWLTELSAQIRDTEKP